MLVHFVISILNAAAVSTETKSLIFSHVIYRHGDRSPDSTFPTDLFQKDHWPHGWKELSNLGMQQQYKLGQYLRQRYQGFLDESYKRDEIYVRASDKDRTIQSALCNLAALYSKNLQKWLPAYDNWYPIPVHTVPEPEDILLSDDVECPAHSNLIEITSKPVIDKLNAQFQNFFEFVKKKTGLERLDVLSIGDVYSPLFCEKSQGYLLPDWASTVFDKETNLTVYETIVYLKTVSKNIQYDSPEKARFKAGYLLGDIIERMNQKVRQKNLKPSKLMMYSTHGDLVSALMYAMSVPNEIIVPYAGCLMIELHKYNINDEYMVEVHYRNETTSEPYRLTVPGCPTYSCPLSLFKKILTDRTLYPAETRYLFCGLQSKCFH